MNQQSEVTPSSNDVETMGILIAAKKNVADYVCIVFVHPAGWLVCVDDRIRAWPSKNSKTTD